MKPLRHRADLPDFSLRHDRRFKHLRLTVTPSEELVVTGPPGVTQARARAFVKENLEWIAGAVQRTRQHSQRLSSTAPTALPESVNFTAIQQTWTVVYNSSQRCGAIRYRAQRGCVELHGETANRALVLATLREFVRTQASQHLSHLLRSLADQTGHSYARVRFGTQRTRWGSCSRRGTISLNSQLLFLPAELVRHVMAHELAHTRHLDHSSDFWALVTRMDPDCQRHRQELRTAHRHIPQWFLETFR
ncbi:MAG: M48 family metallopeptidase [Armatimonadetes bacterium]|nr:M48 family metallopeptidase [Armatimonadota bacterium]